MLCLSTTNIVVDRAKRNVRTLFPPTNRHKIHMLIILIVDSHPISQMFIGQGLSLEACCAAQAERWAFNIATAAASAVAAAAAEWALCNRVNEVALASRLGKLVVRFLSLLQRIAPPLLRWLVRRGIISMTANNDNGINIATMIDADNGSLF